jgi:hypothetical protein
VPGRAQGLAQLVLQFESGVIGAYRDFHGNLILTSAPAVRIKVCRPQPLS